jgi:hypothetical protein
MKEKIAETIHLIAADHPVRRCAGNPVYARRENG